jgi:hypothetical protein
MSIILAADGGEWNTDPDSAPKGVDLLLALCTIDGEARIHGLGMRVFLEDRYGSDTLEGKRGDWYWSVDGEDEFLQPHYIAAWRMPPALPDLKQTVVGTVAA